ncbi:MAG: alpha-amylase/4-alpha-glucanotransferase domain-containing protein [Gemmatimonadota bacterium]
MTGPLRFCFGLHLHQPVGNFASVFEQHLLDVYRPLLRALMDGEAAPVALHLSGPLLEWLEQHAPEFVDEIGLHASQGRLEILAAGHDEPILAVLPRDDRLEQVVRHREHLQRRFGADVRGLWLTERVWEPTLPEDLARAGIQFAIVDDRHFVVAGFARERLHRHFLTESGGERVALFPIDEDLRYLVPFRPPSELAAYFRRLRAAGHQLAILADDGEKFGGWPGTHQWVYADGWMERFLATLRELRDSGEVVLSRFDAALQQTPSGGLAYLPSASYREMEGWSLPPVPARALLRLEEEWGSARLAGVEGGLLRGSHWRNFLVKYPESNRMHKLMLSLSARSRAAGDPPAVRRAIGKGQCNDAYWHGVFGGLYLDFLRGAIWEQLATAEALLRSGEPLALEVTDFDADGADELWLHSSRLSALIAPSRGGSVEFFLDLEARDNILNVMTRHEEAYHLTPLTAPGGESNPGASPHISDVAGAPSIHELEALTERPPIDVELRALFVDRLLSPTTTREDFIAGKVEFRRSWATTAFQYEWTVRPECAEVRLQADGLRKVLRFDADGSVHCAWEWNAPADAASVGGWFSSELSVSTPLEIHAPGAECWEYTIETVAKSERGFDHTIQGSAFVYRWPVSAGRAELTVRRTIAVAPA